MENVSSIHGKEFRLVDGEVYISESGHLHRSPEGRGYYRRARTARHKLAKGILFDGMPAVERNELMEKLRPVVAEHDGRIFKFSARHYLREAANGFRLHRHGQYDTGRIKIKENAVILFADTPEKMQAIHEILVPSTKKKAAPKKKKSVTEKVASGAKKVVKKATSKVKKVTDKVEKAVKPKTVKAKAPAKKKDAAKPATPKTKVVKATDVPKSAPAPKAKVSAKPKVKAAAKPKAEPKAKTTKVKADTPKKPVTKKKATSKA